MPNAWLICESDVTGYIYELTVPPVYRVAGVDTSTTTLGFVLWELSRRPDVVERLRHELDEVMSDRRTFPVYASLMKLPYLTAVIQEGTFLQNIILHWFLL